MWQQHYGYFGRKPTLLLNPIRNVLDGLLMNYFPNKNTSSYRYKKVIKWSQQLLKLLHPGFIGQTKKCVTWRKWSKLEKVNFYVLSKNQKVTCLMTLKVDNAKSSKTWDVWWKPIWNTIHVNSVNCNVQFSHKPIFWGTLNNENYKSIVKVSHQKIRLWAILDTPGWLHGEKMKELQMNATVSSPSWLLANS